MAVLKIPAHNCRFAFHLYPCPRLQAFQPGKECPNKSLRIYHPIPLLHLPVFRSITIWIGEHWCNKPPESFDQPHNSKLAKHPSRGNFYGKEPDKYRYMWPVWYPTVPDGNVREVSGIPQNREIRNKTHAMAIRPIRPDNRYPSIKTGQKYIRCRARLSTIPCCVRFRCHKSHVSDIWHDPAHTDLRYNYIR